MLPKGWTSLHGFAWGSASGSNFVFLARAFGHLPSDTPFISSGFSYYIMSILW
jgi:hypothetical protein